EVDDQRPSNDGAAGNQAPEAGILTVVAVVAKHEVHAGRHHQFAVMGEGLHLAPPVRIDVGVAVDAGGKVVSKGVGSGRLKSGIRLVQRESVHFDTPILHADVVAGKPDDALDEPGRVGRVDD